MFGLIRGHWPAADDRITEEEQLLLRLAELVAKLAHNAAGPPPFFDYHAGWQVGPPAVRLATAARDAPLRDRIEAALGDWPPTGAAEAGASAGGQ